MDGTIALIQFGKYAGKTPQWIFLHNEKYFFWAYEEEFFDTDAKLKEAASEIYELVKKNYGERSIWDKINQLWRYSTTSDSDIKERAENQLYAAIELLSKKPKTVTKSIRKTLFYQYLLLFAKYEDQVLWHKIKDRAFPPEELRQMLGIEQVDWHQIISEVEIAYKNVRFDLYNYRAFTIDGQNLSDSEGIKLLKKMISGKARKGVRTEQRTLRSLKETLKKHGVPKFVLERLKWKKGKAFATFAKGKLIFLPKR
jgi:hypothetical protein